MYRCDAYLFWVFRQLGSPQQNRYRDDLPSPHLRLVSCHLSSSRSVPKIDDLCRVDISISGG